MEPAAATGTSEAATLTGTVRHLAGVLWDDMLSEMNKTGLDASALGPGGDAFQSLFMWNIAQNDFGTFDKQLTDAALRQLGGTPAAGQTIVASPPLLPAGAAGLAAGANSAAAAGVSLAMAPEAALAPGPLLERAKAFARAVWPGVSQAAASLGVPAVGLLAQAALETNWGGSVPGNNLFGIKASPGQDATWQPTHEMQAGVMVPTNAAFRAYGDVQSSIADYVHEIRSVFPHVAGQGSVAGFAQALAQGGFATDRNYAAKLITLAGSPLMAAAMSAITPGPESPQK
jgi:flagellar protein FlgJ